MRHPSPWPWTPALGLVLASACTGSEGAPARTLHLRHVDPASRDGVFLNETLTFHFDADVDPLSVGRESVVIETRQGERARGTLSVERAKVVFRPDVPRAPDLSDGGYRPASEYLVRLAGFPCPDGIRGLHGEPLVRTETRSFTTVALDSPRSSQLFDDPHQEYCNPPDLYPRAPGAYTIGVDDAIYLACEKQIDPTSVRSGDFVLKHRRAGGEQRIELHVRLLENEPRALREPPREIRGLHTSKSWGLERRAALLELKATETLEPGGYELRYDPPAPPAGEEIWSLRDFSLHPLFSGTPSFKQIRVVAGMDSPSRGEPLIEDFVDGDLRAPMFVPDCDGTAAWAGTGRVEVRYPLAAGDGSADALSLGETEARRDVQATSIDLAAGQTCRLDAGPGLVVLRAQGRITLRGTLERATPFAEALDCSAESGVPLSYWLARAQAANKSWLVLIAGGDLVVEGEIRCEVPVLLIAGGQVRNSSPRAFPAGRIWTQSGAPLARGPLERGEARFELDPPVGRNPLRAPLRYAVVSGPVPATGPVARWISARLSGGLEPAKPQSASPGRTPSSFHVRYFPADASQAPDFGKGPTSPAFLPQPGPVRFVVELVLGDQEDWQAPYVDRVQLEYEQPR